MDSTLYDQEEQQLEELVHARIDQLGQAIVVVLQFIETLADQNEVIPEGMYHFLWVKLEKLKALSDSLTSNE